MMAGMLRVFGEDGTDTLLNVLIIFFGAHITVKGEGVECLCFKIIGVFFSDCFERLDTCGFSFFSIRFF